MAVKLRDIAKRVGTTPQTVSHVLNNRAAQMRISSELARRVKMTAKKMNYRPNRMAQSLRHQRSKTIGLVSPSIEREAAMTELEQIQRILWSKGFKVLVGFSGNDLEHEREIMAEFRAMCVDGTILFPCEFSRTDQLKEFADADPPVLLVNPPADYHGHFVRIDTQTGMRQALGHLLEQGHRHIAFLGIRKHLYLEQERIDGIVDAYERAGVAPPEPQDYFHGDPPATEREDQYRVGHEGACAIRDSGRGYTAIVARTDQIAIGAIRSLTEQHVAVPDDMAVLGYNGLPVARYCSPALSTVAPPVDKLGQVVVDFILKLIAGPSVDQPLQKTLTSELIIRESTRRPDAVEPFTDSNTNH